MTTRFVQEWLKQAQYDMRVARLMLKGGRTPYAVFMCHLSIEKALKGLYCRKFGEVPPKTHNLLYLAGRSGVRLKAEHEKFLAKRNEAQIATRYPDDLAQVLENNDRPRVSNIPREGGQLLSWIKQKCSES